MKSYVTMYEDELKDQATRMVSIQTNLTNVCPQNCIMCHKPEWAQIQTGRNAALDPIHTAQELNSLPNLETVVFSGGDPMNYRHLKEYMGALGSWLTFGMFTTGLDNAINRYADLPLEKFGYIRFSIDGNTPSTWAKIRGSHVNSYEVAWKNMLFVSGEMKKMYGNQNGMERVRVQFTIQSENINEFPDMVEKCYRHGVPIYGYWVHDYNVVSKEQVADLRLELSHRMANNAALKNWCERWTNVEEIASLGDSVPRALNPSNCIIPLVHAFIDTDGSVFPCCYLVGDNLPFDQRDIRYSYGNIYETPLRQILSRAGINKVLTNHINGQNEICVSCCTARSRYYKMNLEWDELRYRRPTFL